MQKTSNSDSVAAVLKVFGVLEALADEKKLSLSELARRAMMSKSTAYRFLQTMQELGYVEQEGDTEKYGLTLKLYGLGAKVLNQQADLVKAADKAMDILSQQISEAVHLGVLDENDQSVVYIHKYDSAYNLRMQSPIGKRNPLYSTSLGKALLAWRGEADLAERLPKLSFVKSAPNTILSLEDLLASLAKTRTEGYAEEMEESEAGVRCMAAPVFDHSDKAVAAISVSFPVFRFDPHRKTDYVTQLRHAGKQTSLNLGFQGMYPGM